MSFIKDITNSLTASVGKVFKESYGPLKALDPTSKDVYTLRYPLDVGNADLYPHTLEFVCWKPEPVPLAQLASGNKNDPVKQAGGVLPAPTTRASKYTKELQRRATDVYGGPRVNQNLPLNGERTTDWTRRATLSDVIVMYVPQQALIETFTNSYDTKSMTEALGTLGIALDAGAAVSKASGIWNKGAALRPFLQQAGSNLLEGAGIIKDSGTVAEAGLQAGGYATNPQLEVLYGGTNMRQFEMQFKMTPRSQKEADEMLNIIWRMKYHASPEYILNGGRYIIPPSYFDIYIKYNGVENTRVPMKFSTCVLESVSVDMGTGTDQFVTFHDGTPIEISMMLRFTELEIMHKALRDKGY